MNRGYKRYAWLLLFSLIIALFLACSGNTRHAVAEKETATSALQMEIAVEGRIYLAGSELSQFVALQVTPDTAYVLLGADSLRHYQDRLARIKGYLQRPGSDSLHVVQVEIK